MSELNKDVIFLILKNLQNDSKSFYSCLLINRIWCETVVPILWKNPSRHQLTENACKILLSVILSHLSGESKDNMMNQGIDIFTETYQRPLFNYISFWKHLDSKFLEFIMNVFVKDKNIELSKISIIRDEILNLFNLNTTFNSLSIKSIPKLSYLISGTELYFSKLDHFYCDSNTNSNFLGGLALTNTSIKKLGFNIMVHTNNYLGIIKLIKVQKNLKEVNFIYNHLRISNELCHKSLEESLINCENTIQYLRIDWKPITNFLSNLINLVSLYIINSCYDYTNWNHLEKVSLPLLKFLKTHQISSWILACLIKNTKGNLIEINIHYQDVDDGRLLKAISQNCPKLCYLKLSSFNSNTLDFENLLINCQSLIGLQIIGIYGCFIDWDKLFETLAKFSPFSLFKFKFKFSFSWQYKLKALKLFLNNWNDRNPILLQIISTEHTYIERQQQQQLEDLFQIYKEKGIIKKYDLENPNNISYNDFEWIQKKGSDTIL
ncbi:hypothetical protein RhiirA1_467577 [Rhizophagus irregularis]|uniref:F-box domain-containing protein n=2 Tax=Rhizophagus irregularis TaxID=588596 RepID=A0A2N0RBS8_9GLOM|nr:hypothetical protein RhiirA1_467577 [Rhizophagus irregularis]